MDYITILAPVAGALALIFAGYLAYSVLKENAGTERMRQISGAVQEGAMAYLNRQYKTIAIFAIVMLAICPGPVHRPKAMGGSRLPYRCHPVGGGRLHRHEHLRPG